MIRYLRLYGYFLRFSFSRAMEFRLDFFFRIVMDAVWYVVQFSFFWVLYRHTALLGGWTFDQVMVFMGGVFVVDALHMTVFSNNMWWFPIYVNKGDLDYHLVRPVSPLFVMSVRDFAANSFVNLLMAVAVLTWTLARYPAPLGAGPVAVYVVSLLVGTFLYYVLHMLFLIPAFWMHTSHGLREIYFVLGETMTRPVGIFTGWVRSVLVSILPFGVIVSFPAKSLFEGASPGPLLHMAAVTAAAFLAMVGMWRWGLRSYVSASS
ncbi:MAG: ABC-2 family transporter protein [Planctomycetes bacterium]|nr:ABC-2 family transporter protein [Planctomycetota bacterium]